MSKMMTPNQPTTSTTSTISIIHKNQIQQLEELKEFYEFEQINDINDLINQINDFYDDGKHIAYDTFKMFMNEHDTTTSNIINYIDDEELKLINLKCVLNRLIKNIEFYIDECNKYNISCMVKVNKAKNDNIDINKIKKIEHLPFYQHFKNTKWLINLYSDYFHCSGYDIYDNNDSIREIIEIIEDLKHIDGINVNSIIVDMEKYFI